MKRLILSLFCGVVGFANAQETDANILGSVQIGSSRYYVLQEPGTGKYFKSEMTGVDILKYGDIVKLEQQIDANGFQQVKDASLNSLFKAKEQVSGNGNNPNYVDPAVLNRLPNLKDGVLFFDNRKHFDELYTLIQNYLESKKNVPGKKDALDVIESKIPGYISFRTFFDAKYPETTIGYTDSEVDAIENEDFFNDEVIKFFFNKNRLIVVGAEFIYAHDFYSFLKTDVKNFDKFRLEFASISAMTNYDLYDNANRIAFNLDIEVLSNNNSLTKDITLINIESASKEKAYHRMKYTQYGTPVACDPYTKGLRVYVEYGTTFLGDPNNSETPYSLVGKNAVLKISWGDGTTQTISNYTSQQVNHTYPTTGTYNVKFKVTFINAFLGISELELGDVVAGQPPIPFIVTDLQCGYPDKAKSQAITSGNWKLYSEIWVTDNWIGNRVGCLTHSWKQNSSGNWNRKIANITAQITAQMRNENCQVVQNLTETDVENQERVDAVKFKLFKRYRTVANADITSYHKLVKGSTTIIVTMEITACP